MQNPKRLGGESLLIICILYIIIAAASIFGLIVASEKYAGINNQFGYGGWVAAGIFWPVALLPCAGYLVALWYLHNNR